MVWLIAIGKGVAITVPVSPVPAEKTGGWKTHNAQVSPEKAEISAQGYRWGEPVKIILTGKPQDPASATLLGKSEDLKDFKEVVLILKGSGKVKVSLYYTFNGKYSLLVKEIDLTSNWKEIPFKLSEGLEFGLGMPRHPNVIIPYKMIISSESKANVNFGGAYIRR